MVLEICTRKLCVSALSLCHQVGADFLAVHAPGLVREQIPLWEPDKI